MQNLYSRSQAWNYSRENKTNALFLQIFPDGLDDELVILAVIAR